MNHKANLKSYQNQFIGTYLSFDKALNDNECSMILNAFDKQKNNQSLIQIEKKHHGFTFNHLFNKIIGHLNFSNQNYFKFYLAKFYEMELWNLEPGFYLDWTTDNLGFENSSRKLSLIVYLTETDSDKGFSFSLIDGANETEPENTIGNILIFPSFRPYKLPMLKHQQTILRIWWHGNAFQ